MDALGINPAGLLTQIVSFLILLLILRALLYRPLLRMLDERSARIRESLESAERVKQDAARAQEDMKGQLEAARAEGQAMITEAREVADRFREEELTRAREEIGAERAKAEANIQQERDAAIEELRRQFAGLAIGAAERVVGRSLDEGAHRDIIDEVLEESSRINGGRG